MDTAVAGEILESVQEHLASYGLQLSPEGLENTSDPSMWKGLLRYDDSTRFLRIVLATPMTATGLNRVGLDDQYLFSSTLPVLVVGRQVHEKSASMFRELGISYADTVGNAHIRLPGVLIDVRGRREPRAHHPPAPSRDASQGPQSRNLFSTGRAKVIAALLAWPGLATQPVREIAASAGVSTGQAHSALDLLDDTGYLVERRLRADRADVLLDLWTAAYPGGLGRKLAVASYTSVNGIDASRDELMASALDSPDDGLVLSGEAVPGIGIRRPLTLTVYSRDWDPRQAVRHRWRAASSTATADIHVRHRFWTPPRSGEGIGTRHDPVAPWPVVYADLMATGDPRLVEVAGDWRRRRGAA